MTIKLHTKSQATLLKLEPQLNTEDERTLSLYLPIRAEGFDAAQYEILIKHIVAEHRHKLAETQKALFDSEVERVRTHLNLVRPAGCPGLAIFSNEAIGMQSLIRLPESIEARVDLGRPLLEPLELMLRRFPPALVVVVAKRDARLFASILGEVVPVGHLEGQEVRHSRAGGTSAPSNQRKAENRARANLKKVVEMMERVVQADGFARVFISGPEEARAELQHELPKSLERLVAGHLSASLDTPPGKLAADIGAQVLKFGPVPTTS
jgi:peptide subunit release factor 1 (eRF1)